MKKVVCLSALSLFVLVPSFAAEHIVSRSAKVVGKESYSVMKASAEDVGKATEDIGKAGAAAVKFIF